MHLRGLQAEARFGRHLLEREIVAQPCRVAPQRFVGGKVETEKGNVAAECAAEDRVFIIRDGGGTLVEVDVAGDRVSHRRAGEDDRVWIAVEQFAAHD